MKGKQFLEKKSYLCRPSAGINWPPANMAVKMRMIPDGQWR